MSSFLWSNLFRPAGDEVDAIARLWRQTPLFREIPERHIRTLCGQMHVRRFKGDETVFHRDDQAAGAILVLDGSVRITVEGTELARLESGDFFGEIGLATAERRTADAVATTPSRLVYFLKQDLEEWIEQQPRLGARFLMNLAETLAARLYLANVMLARRA